MDRLWLPEAFSDSSQGPLILHLPLGEVQGSTGQCKDRVSKGNADFFLAACRAHSHRKLQSAMSKIRGNVRVKATLLESLQSAEEDVKVTDRHLAFTKKVTVKGRPCDLKLCKTCNIYLCSPECITAHLYDNPPLSVTHGCIKFMEVSKFKQKKAQPMKARRVAAPPQRATTRAARRPASNTHR